MFYSDRNPPRRRMHCASDFHTRRIASTSSFACSGTSVRRRGTFKAANAYLQEFPKSPYVDDVLFSLADFERMKEPEKAKARLEALLRDYPQSPWKSEAENLLVEMKEIQEWKAEIKAAREQEIQSPKNQGAGPPQSPNP